MATIYINGAKYTYTKLSELSEVLRENKISIDETAHIGDDVWIETGVSIDRWAFVGNGAMICQYASIGHDALIGEFSLIGQQHEIAPNKIVPFETKVW